MLDLENIRYLFAEAKVVGKLCILVAVIIEIRLSRKFRGHLHLYKLPGIDRRKHFLCISNLLENIIKLAGIHYANFFYINLKYFYV